MTKPKADTVNSHAIKSNAPSGDSISLTRKICAMFQQKQGAALKRIYAGLNSSYVSSKKQSIQTHRMFTPRGILDLQLTLAEVTLLLNSQALSDKERTDLQTYMKTIETTSDNVTHATVVEEQHAPPKKHYFYCYQYSFNGAWFSTMLHNTPEDAFEDMTDTGIVHKKLCCIVL
jgi:hypothetical protein